MAQAVSKANIGGAKVSKYSASELIRTLYDDEEFAQRAISEVEAFRQMLKH